MSEIYKALKRSERDGAGAMLITDEIPSEDKVRQLPALSSVPGNLPEKRLQVVSNPAYPLVALGNEKSLAAEKFRILASRLAHQKRDYNIKIIQITSAVVGEGKSTVAANLAVTLSRRPEERVLLVDGDLHRPTLTNLFGTGAQPGLGEWWEHSAEAIPQCCRINELRLWLLPAGLTRHPAELLQSARLPELLRELGQLFDWVIIDSPPMLPLTDANLWARRVDGTLLVVRQGLTPKRALEKGLDTLDSPKIVGVVLNEASEGERGHHYEQYYGVAHTKAGK